MPEVKQEISAHQKQQEKFEFENKKVKIESPSVDESESNANEEPKRKETPSPRSNSRQKDEIWTPEKIKLLLQWVQDYRKDWKKVAKRFNEKEITPFQVKKKYRALKANDTLQLRVRFSLKEDLMIAKYFNQYGYSWSKISTYFENRDAIMVKNRYYSYIRKKKLLDKLLQTVEALEAEHQKPIEEIDVPASMTLFPDQDE